MLGVVLTLRGDRGAVLVGAVESITFADWTLTPQGGNVSALRVTLERRHAYYSQKRPTGLRIHFRGPAGSPADTGPVRGSATPITPTTGDDHTWWTWRNVTIVGPGHYHVEGLPEVS
jgi:hypothetical protein